MMVGARQMLLTGVIINLLLLLPNRLLMARAVWPNTWCPSYECDVDGRSTMDCTGRARRCSERCLA